MGDLAFPVGCASMGHLLMTQALPFMFEYLLQPAYGSPPTTISHPIPSHQPNPYRVNPLYYVLLEII